LWHYILSVGTNLIDGKKVTILCIIFRNVILFTKFRVIAKLAEILGPYNGLYSKVFDNC